MSIGTAAVLAAAALAGICFQGAVVIGVSLRQLSESRSSRMDGEILLGVLSAVLALIFVGLYLSGLSISPLTLIAGMVVGALLVEVPWLFRTRKRPRTAPDTGEDTAAATEWEQVTVPVGAEASGSMSVTLDDVDLTVRWEPAPDRRLAVLKVESARGVLTGGLPIMLVDSDGNVHLVRTSALGIAEFHVPLGGARLSLPPARPLGATVTVPLPQEELVLAADTVRREVLRTIVLADVTVNLLEARDARTGRRELQIAVESRTAENDGSWVVVEFGRSGEPPSVLAVPLTWNPELERAFGALRLGSPAGRPRLSVVPELVHDPTEISDEILGQSGPAAADDWTATAFRRALGEDR
jgi:hypothetical protein